MTFPYHLAIIGTRFPQLALGALFAKRGKRVAIIEAAEDRSASKGGGPEGFRFRKRPFPLFGLDTGGFLRKFLDEIGVGHVLVSQTYPRNDVSYQLVLPGHRLNVYPDRERSLAEIAREYPDSLDPMREMYSQWDTVASNWFSELESLDVLEQRWFPITSTGPLIKNRLHTRKLAGLYQGIVQGKELGDFLSLQHHFLGACDPQADLNLLAGAIIHNLGRRGTFKETDGTSSLTDLVLQRFQEYGGDILKGEKVTSVKAFSPDGMSMELSGGSEIRSRAIATTAEIAASINGFAGRAWMNGKVAPPLFPVRFYIGLDEKFVPRGMEDNLFFMREESGGPLGIRSCYLALSPHGSTMAPEGMRSLTVTSFVTRQALDRSASAGTERAYADILGALEAVIPFLDEGLVSISSDLDSLLPGIQERRPLPIARTSWSPWLTGHRAIVPRHRGKMAIIKQPPSELGIEGEALAALAAASVLKKAIGTQK